MYKLLIICTVFFSFNIGLSQNKKEKNVVKEVDKVNKKVSDTNDKINNTNDSVKNTIKDSKETVNEVKETIESIFKSKKNKENVKNAKGTVAINIAQIEYDDPNLETLYECISKVRGMKKLTKDYKNNNIAISMVYKNGADALWQEMPKKVRSSFKLVQIADNTIVLKLRQE